MSRRIETIRHKRFVMEAFRFGEQGREPIVLLPGLSVGSVLAYADAIADAYRIFAEEFEIFVLDRRLDLPPSYSVWDMADDTTEAMVLLGIQAANLYGVSQGGMIAQAIALRHPELVKRMMLGSTAARLSAAAKELLQTWVRLAREGDAKGLIDAFCEAVYSEAFYLQNRDALLSMANGITQKDLSRFLILAEQTTDFNCYEDLSRITCPVLVQGAGKDRVLGREASVELAHKLGCALCLYEDCGHAAYDEAPDFKALSYRFFKGDPI